MDSDIKRLIQFINSSYKKRDLRWSNNRFNLSKLGLGRYKALRELDCVQKIGGYDPRDHTGQYFAPKEAEFYILSLALEINPRLPCLAALVARLESGEISQGISSGKAAKAANRL